MTNLCEAQRRGYIPVRVTKHVNGWPVGYHGWLDPATRDKVWNDDCTTHWFHTLGDSCERIIPTMNLSNFKAGDKVKLPDGSIETITEILPERTYSLRGGKNIWTSNGRFSLYPDDHPEFTPEPFSVGSVHTTRDGRKAMIISTNLTDSPDEMLVLITGPKGDDYALLYKETGRYFKSAGNDDPLDIIPPTVAIRVTIPAHRQAELEAFINALR